MEVGYILGKQHIIFLRVQTIQLIQNNKKKQMEFSCMSNHFYIHLLHVSLTKI